METELKLGSFMKQPAERLSVSIRYGDALDLGDSIATVDYCAAEPVDLTVSPVLAADDRVRIFAQGGTDGTNYKITVRVTTANGEVLEDELICKLREI